MNKKRFLFAGIILSLLMVTNVWASPYDVCFSFASDEWYLNGPGQGGNFNGSVVNGQNRIDGRGYVNLVVDVNGKENPGGLVTFHCKFSFMASPSTFRVCPLPWGGFALQWKTNGVFNFYATNAPLGVNPLILRTTFQNALLTAYSPTGNQIRHTLTLQASDAFPGLVMTPGPILQCMGITSLGTEKNFAFTMTNKIPSAISVNNLGIFSAAWRAEGSYSASAIRPH